MGYAVPALPERKRIFKPLIRTPWLYRHFPLVRPCSTTLSNPVNESCMAGSKQPGHQVHQTALSRRRSCGAWKPVKKKQKQLLSMAPLTELQGLGTESANP